MPTAQSQDSLGQMMACCVNQHLKTSLFNNGCLVSIDDLKDLFVPNTREEGHQMTGTDMKYLLYDWFHEGNHHGLTDQLRKASSVIEL